MRLLPLPNNEKKLFSFSLRNWGISLFVVFGFTLPTFAVDDPGEMLPNRAQEVRAEAIGEQLRCLVCQNQSIEDSSAPLARDLRHLVRAQISAGYSDQAVIGFMVARYGNFVRLKPPFDSATWLLWLSPLLALSVGFGLILAGHRRRADPLPFSEAEREELRRLLGSE